MGLSLLSVWTLVVVDGAALVVLAVLLRRPGPTAAAGPRDRGRRGWWRSLALAAVAGALVGVGATWWAGDVVEVLDVPPTLVDRAWVALLGASTGAVVVAAARSTVRRRVGAAGAVLLFVVATGLAVNRDAGLFPTVGSVLGVSGVPPLALPAGQHGTTTVLGEGDRDGHAPGGWTAPPDLPVEGRLGSVAVPGTASGFAARDALVWLPPAALVADPPVLPVVVALSGQGPGASPQNLVEAGRLTRVLDDLAVAHDGLAPIVVMPDQLGRATANPMCVDGPLGDSETYLTRDVPAWVTAHLGVRTGRGSWSVAGFSQGGTCAIQLAAGHPELFGSAVDVSGQRGPRLDGGVDRTVRQGFGGDRAAYRAAQPEALLAAHAPYPDSAAFFSVGADDERYGPVVPVLADAARAAGMAVTTVEVPDAGHDWQAARAGLEQGLGWLQARTGLADADPGG